MNTVSQEGPQHKLSCKTRLWHGVSAPRRSDFGPNKAHLPLFSVITLSVTILWPFISLSHPVSASAWGSMTQFQSHSQARGSFSSSPTVTLISITSPWSCAALQFVHVQRAGHECDSPLFTQAKSHLCLCLRVIKSLPDLMASPWRANYDVSVCVASIFPPDKIVFYQVLLL